MSRPSAPPINPEYKGAYPLYPSYPSYHGLGYYDTPVVYESNNNSDNNDPNRKECVFCKKMITIYLHNTVFAIFPCGHVCHITCAIKAGIDDSSQHCTINVTTLPDILIENNSITTGDSNNNSSDSDGTASDVNDSSDEIDNNEESFIKHEVPTRDNYDNLSVLQRSELLKGIDGLYALSVLNSDLNMRFFKKHGISIRNILRVNGINVGQIYWILKITDIKSLLELGLTKKEILANRKTLNLVDLHAFYQIDHITLRDCFSFTLQDYFDYNGKQLKTIGLTTDILIETYKLTKSDFLKFKHITFSQWINLLKLSKKHIKIIDLDFKDFIHLGATPKEANALLQRVK